jgi:hypothetical protein
MCCCKSPAVNLAALNAYSHIQNKCTPLYSLRHKYWQHAFTRIHPYTYIHTYIHTRPADWNNGGALAKIEQTQPDIKPGAKPDRHGHLPRESDGVLAHVKPAEKNGNWLDFERWFGSVKVKIKWLRINRESRRHSRSRSRSRTIYFSNISWRKMNNSSQPSYREMCKRGIRHWGGNINAQERLKLGRTKRNVGAQT